MSRTILFLLCALALLTPAAHSASEIQGMMTADGVTGRQSTPHGWMEERVYACPIGSGTGAGFVTAHTPPGWFSIKRPFAAGDYAIYTLKYDGIPAFDFLPGLEVPAGDAKVENIGFNGTAHYSVMYNKGPNEWGEDPWVDGIDFYQTFVATTRHITRIGTRLADKRPEYTHLNLNYAVYETGDGPPSTWKRISPIRFRPLSPRTDPIIHIFWVPFLSREVVLEPGKEYAVRLWRRDDSQSTEFTLVARRDQGDGYKAGKLYIGDEPQEDWDAFLYVSGGAAGTVVNFAPVESFDLSNSGFLGWNNRFGQTFKATGNGLAGVDIIYARTQDLPLETPVTFRVYDKPGGKQIGPTKTIPGVPGAFQARAAVYYAPGEVPLKAGKKYYIECESEGLNVWQMNEDVPGVEAWVDGESKAPADAAMSIAEYMAEE